MSLGKLSVLTEAGWGGELACPAAFPRRSAFLAC